MPVVILLASLRTIVWGRFRAPCQVPVDSCHGEHLLHYSRGRLKPLLLIDEPK